MQIGIVTPAPPGSNYGNRITALRWARILRKLGHRVLISQAYDGEPYDLLIALHARRSYRSIKCFCRDKMEAPVVVALTGTDLYHDIRGNHLARESLQIATRIVTLQPSEPRMPTLPSIREARIGTEATIASDNTAGA